MEVFGARDSILKELACRQVKSKKSLKSKVKKKK